MTRKKAKKTSAKDAVNCIEHILEILYPEGDPDHEWEGDTIELVAEVLSNYGFGPEED